MTEPQKSHIETKYTQVDALSIDSTGGFIIPNGEEHIVYRFRANGSDPTAYVALIWDYLGLDQKILASTKGDIDIFFDVSYHGNHILGDGSKSLKVVIINDNDSQSPIIGGSFETIKVD